MDAEPLLNVGELATELRRSRWYVTAMKRGGYRFLIPGKTTRSHAIEWLKNNPDFSPSHLMTARKTKELRKKGKGN